MRVGGVVVAIMRCVFTMRGPFDGLVSRRVTGRPYPGCFGLFRTQPRRRRPREVMVFPRVVAMRARRRKIARRTRSRQPPTSHPCGRACGACLHMHSGRRRPPCAGRLGGHGLKWLGCWKWLVMVSGPFRRGVAATDVSQTAHLTGVKGASALFCKVFELQRFARRSPASMPVEVLRKARRVATAAHLLRVADVAADKCSPSLRRVRDEREACPSAAVLSPDAATRGFVAKG